MSLDKRFTDVEHGELIESLNKVGEEYEKKLNAFVLKVEKMIEDKIKNGSIEFTSFTYRFDTKIGINHDKNRIEIYGTEPRDFSREVYSAFIEMLVDKLAKTSIFLGSSRDGKKSEPFDDIIAYYGSRVISEKIVSYKEQKEERRKMKKTTKPAVRPLPGSSEVLKILRVPLHAAHIVASGDKNTTDVMKSASRISDWLGEQEQYYKRLSEGEATEADMAEKKRREKRNNAFMEVLDAGLETLSATAKVLDPKKRK